MINYRKGTTMKTTRTQKLMAAAHVWRAGEPSFNERRRPGDIELVK